MLIDFGKYENESLYKVMIEDPSYVSWLLGLDTQNFKVKRVKNKAEALMEIFDGKPLLLTCKGRECSSKATRFSAFKQMSYGWKWWCEDCDPYSLGANNGALSIISTYRDVLDFCSLYSIKSNDLKDLIKDIAQCKGLPKKCTLINYSIFFHS